jgi:hypothetical protein
MSDFLEQQYISPLVNEGYVEADFINLPDGTYMKYGGGYQIQIHVDSETPTKYILITNTGIRGMWTGKEISVFGGTTNENVYKIMTTDPRWTRNKKIDQILK